MSNFFRKVERNQKRNKGEFLEEKHNTKAEDKKARKERLEKIKAYKDAKKKEEKNV